MLLTENSVVTLKIFKKLNKRRNRKHTHVIYKNRVLYGEFHRLYLQLREDETAYFSNFISATGIHIPYIEIISCMHSYGGLQSHLTIILSGTYACTNN
ncbi:unnamed protein product [Acanthoscelides obtectus]|uniref:Uncharacterized protein n=1 Tax=Acanthoscelides obtectus TaxID=200917 RepID=A0A9P0LKN4_ACAOB|nr:unnamed protein product [Acanthoscelides obtectus]CAK1680667.1 hypothetical protein AOBTE_LOCUS32831 [Acanthoscelides obtectus]